MAESVGQLKWDLDLDDVKFIKKLRASKGEAQSFGSKVGGVFASVGKAAIKMGVVAGAAFVGFSVLSVKAAAESQAALAQLGAVLKSTGGVAGVTSKQAIELSKSLQRVTTFSDEAVLGAENLLLTFTNIGKNIFPEATKTVLDMSTALGQDTKSSAIQLGKALQDPIRGVNALRRVGVNFTEKQQEMIKTLVESGRSLEAQKLILKELQTEFGGSATAASKTFGGALKQLGNSVNDLQETFGRALITAITPFVKSLADWATSKSGEQAIQRLITGFQVFAQVIGNIIITVWPVLVKGFTDLGTIIKAVTHAINFLANIFKIILLPELIKIWVVLNQQLFPELLKLWRLISPILIPALKILAIVIGAILLGAIYILLKVLPPVISVFSRFIGVINFVTGGVKSLIDFIKSLINAVKGIAGAFMNPIESLKKFGDAAKNVLSKLNPLAAFKGVKIPGFASGVQNFSGGAAMVGERGPELVNLPRGSSVTPNDKVGGDTFNINLAGIMARSRADLREIGKDIIRSIDEERRAKGEATIL